MQLYLHQTHHKIADFNEIFTYLTNIYEQESKSNKSSIHFFPELFLTGYPLQDLCLSKDFILNYLKLKKDLDEWSVKQKPKHPIHFVFGGLEYHLNQNHFPLKIFNSAFHLEVSKKMKHVYDKRLLPNYDIFDEEKYYCPGDKNCILEIEGLNIGLFICEDMWHSSVHDQDPILNFFEEINKSNQRVDFIVNLSASPFHLGKQDKRFKRAQEICRLSKVPFLYVNKVGLEDEILFDGQSFIMDGEDITRSPKFKADVLPYIFKEAQKSLDFSSSTELSILENTLESLFRPRVELTKEQIKLKKLSDNELEVLTEALIFSLKDYALKNNFKSFCVALSGGIDSTIVLVLAHLLCKQSSAKEAFQLHTVFMPGNFTSTLSYDASQNLCDNLGIKLRNLPIKFLHSTFKNAFLNAFGNEISGISDENVQSRLRGLSLCALSNHTNSLILNTSNKSEIAVGYSTLYGDSIGGISLLGDLYKSEVYQLANYLNEKYDHLIPEEIITRPPSAELRENQTDSESLPDYDRLDLLLECLLSFSYSQEELIKLGFNSEEVTNLCRLIDISEYKRKQFCPIVKVNSKSFGFGHRLPISKKIN